MTMTNRLYPALSLLAAVALGGCDITRADAPTLARVVAEVDAAEPLQLIISTRFSVVLDAQTGNVDPAFLSADTLYITGDYEEALSLDPNDSRIFVHLGNETESVAPVRLRVFLDGEVDYDASANLGNGGFLEYLYRFNQPTLGGR